MAAMGRSADCGCHFSAPGSTVRDFSTGRVRVAFSSSSSSFADLRSLSAKFSNSNLGNHGELGFTKWAPLLGTRPRLFAVVVLSSQAGGAAVFGRKNSTAPEAAYEKYGEQQQGGVEVLRPPVIPWDKSLANAVQLIGNVGRDVDLKYLDSGKVLARTSIAVKRPRLNKESDTSWFEVEFWDALAEIAGHHVKKGQQIFVSGTIVVERWMKDEVQHTVAKVLAGDLCFIEPYSGQRRSSVLQHEVEYEDMGPSSGSGNWNQQQVFRQSTRGTVGEGGSVKSSSEAALATEKRWQEYFADPSQWWDNRHNKRNIKAPDFKHKITQESLWLDGWNNPPWVQQQLIALENTQAEHTADNVNSHQQRSQTKNLTPVQDSDFIY